MVPPWHRRLAGVSPQSRGLCPRRSYRWAANPFSVLLPEGEQGWIPARTRGEKDSRTRVPVYPMMGQSPTPECEEWLTRRREAGVSRPRPLKTVPHSRQGDAWAGGWKPVHEAAVAGARSGLYGQRSILPILFLHFFRLRTVARVSLALLDPLGCAVLPRTWMVFWPSMAFFNPLWRAVLRHPCQTVWFLATALCVAHIQISLFD